MTTNANLDTLGAALAAINSAGSGAFAFAYSTTTGQIAYTTGVTFNATQAQITALVNGFNTLASAMLAAGLSMTQVDALGAALASTSRPILFNSSTHQCSTSFGTYNYSLSPSELAAIHTAFNALAVQLVGTIAPPAPSAASALPMASVRLGLTGDLDVYVSSAGSDTTGDGTQGNPWATISHAYDVFATDYDLRRKTVTVHLLTNMAGPGLLQGELPGLLNPLSFHIRSDNPAAPVTLTVPAGQPQNAVFAAGFRAAFSVSDVIVQVPSGGFGFLCEGGEVFGGNIAFTGTGAVAIIDVQGAYSSFVQTGPLTFNGCSATTAVRVEDLGFASLGSQIICAGSPSFTWFAGADLGGMIDATGMSVSGTAGGEQYNVSTNGIVFTGGAGTAFPGTGGSTDGQGLRVP